MQPYYWRLTVTLFQGTPWRRLSCQNTGKLFKNVFESWIQVCDYLPPHQYFYRGWHLSNSGMHASFLLINNYVLSVFCILNPIHLFALKSLFCSSLNYCCICIPSRPKMYPPFIVINATEQKEHNEIPKIKNILKYCIYWMCSMRTVY